MCRYLRFWAPQLERRVHYCNLRVVPSILYPLCITTPHPPWLGASAPVQHAVGRPVACPVQATLEPKSPSSVQAVLTVIGTRGGRVDLPPWCPPWAAWVAAFAPECVGSARRHWHSWAAGVGPCDLDLVALLGSDGHSTFFHFRVSVD